MISARDGKNTSAAVSSRYPPQIFFKKIHILGCFFNFGHSFQGHIKVSQYLLCGSQYLIMILN